MEAYCEQEDLDSLEIILSLPHEENPYQTYLTRSGRKLLFLEQVAMESGPHAFQIRLEQRGEPEPLSMLRELLERFEVL